MKIAIMQPYLFPCVGYFQLINAVDKFIFYDNVAFINQGWINRNKILINGEPKYITVSLKHASQNKLINEIEIIDNRKTLKKTIYRTYHKAPFFYNAWAVVEKCMDYTTSKIGELAAYSVIQTCDYLGINTDFEYSSIMYPQTVHLGRIERLIEISKINNATHYINSIGGAELYNKYEFLQKGVNLHFIKSDQITYKQFKNSFVGNLSIIDVIMFNSVKKIQEMLYSYELI
jgi:hypothetical protein